jgi:hypothetical protein
MSRPAAPTSPLSPEVAEMLLRFDDDDDDDDDDETTAWRFEEDTGAIDWRRAPPCPPPSSAPSRTVARSEPARALRRLATVSLRRVARGELRSRADDEAAHGPLLERLHRDLRAIANEEKEEEEEEEEEELDDAPAAAPRRRRRRSSYVILALSLAILERRVADLYVADGARSPLLSEVLASSRVAEALTTRADVEDDMEDDVDATWPLRMALDPRCLNLRNVTWHGFLLPADARPELAALALTLAASIPPPRGRGRRGGGLNSKTTATDGGDGTRDLERCERELLARAPSLGGSAIADADAAERARRVVARSSFLPPGWRAPAGDAIEDLLRDGDDASFVAVVAVAVEAALRATFAKVRCFYQTASRTTPFACCGVRRFLRTDFPPRSVSTLARPNPPYAAVRLTGQLDRTSPIEGERRRERPRRARGGILRDPGRVRADARARRAPASAPTPPGE